MRKAVNTSAIRRLNVRTILDIVKREGKVSRSVLAQLAGLSRSTASTVLEGLASVNLVVEAGYENPRGGRPARLVQLNRDAGYVIGVAQGYKNLSGIVVDMGGTAIGTVIDSFDRDEGGDIFEVICSIIERSVHTSGVGWEKIKAIGLGVPGVVAPDVGRVSRSALGWADFPMKQLLQERFKVPVCLENDVNASALGELTFGVGTQVDDFVFIAIGTGIGAGVVLQRELRRGRHFSAGEIGYMCIDPNWKSAMENDVGRFEYEAGARALQEKATSVLGSAASIEDLFRAMRDGNLEAEKEVRQIARLLAMAIHNIWILLDPQCIVLGGRVSQLGNKLLEPIMEEYLRLSPTAPQILLSELGVTAPLLGAATIALERAETDFIDKLSTQ